MTLARAVLSALLVLASAAGCSSEPQASPADATYAVRGRVEGVTRPAEGAPLLDVHHEEIPTFRSREGEVVGMEPMVMQFRVGAGVDASEVAQDDLVDLTFDVRWSGADMLTITRLRELPPGTALSLGDAH